MVFSDTVAKTGIIQQIEFRTLLGDAGISGDATLLKQVTGMVNDYYMKAVGIIIGADGRWRWDDTNIDNYPSATTDLDTDRHDYIVMSSAPDTDQDWLEVERVECKDSSGKWYTLRPRNLRGVGTSITEDRTVSGTPTYYDFDGVSIWLDQAPSYDSTDGLKVWFNRAPIEFISTDTTKRPGFNTLFHEYLVLGPVYIWRDSNQVGDSEKTQRDLAKMEKDMAKYYGNRGQYEVNKLARPYKSYK